MNMICMYCSTNCRYV